MPHLKRKIQQSVYFKLLNPEQQDVVLSKTNRSHLQRGIQDAKKRGYDKWKQDTNFSDYNNNIIHELTINTQPHGKS